MVEEKYDLNGKQAPQHVERMYHEQSKLLHRQHLRYDKRGWTLPHEDVLYFIKSGVSEFHEGHIHSGLTGALRRDLTKEIKDKFM